MKKLSITFLSLLLLSTAAVAGESAYWQVVLSYTPDTVRIVEVTPIAPLRKIPRTPGLTGAPVKIDYDFSWLDGGGIALAHTSDQLPLGYRTAPADSAACQTIMPSSGLIVLRLAGPAPTAQPTVLLLKKTMTRQSSRAQVAVPPVFENSTLTLPIERISQPSPRLAGPIGSAKIRDTGPDANRMVIVVMGDGYTAADLETGSFTTAANGLVNAFLGKSPWDAAFSVANVYRVDVTSNQSGSDHDPQGTFKDTYFNSSFWVADIERLLAIDGTGQSRAISAANTYVGAGVWDAIFILVNSAKYGGSGGFISVSSVHPSASEVILHEFGHTYGGLADEYSSAYPGYPPGDPEPNVDFDFSGPGLKWLMWVDSTTPLPTPANGAYSTKVGAFEGARYLTTGIYRPWLNCLMRSLGVGFCPVCKEALLQNLFGEVTLADTAMPIPATTVLASNSESHVVVTPIPITGLSYQWKLGGIVQPETGADFLLTADRIYSTVNGPAGQLSVKLSYASPLIRKFSVVKTINWSARADCNQNGQADDLDLTQGILHDFNSDGYPDECVIVPCCADLTGNVDCSVGDGVDISDLSALIDYLYISFASLCCPEEANSDGQPGTDIADLAALIDYLYISFTPLAPCQ